MRKRTWMAQLERALSREGINGTEKRTVLNYYEEMYQDRLDEGAYEEDIIKEFGFPEDVASSVREECGERNRKEGSRNDDGYYNEGQSQRVDLNLYFNDQTGTYAPRNYDVEAQGYSRPAQQCAAPTAASAPVNDAPPKKKGSSMSAVRMIVYILIAIVFLATGFGLSVCGILVIVASFLSIAFSAGLWLIAFGVGLIIFSIGCLIFGAGIKLIKSTGDTVEGGAK